MSAKTGTGTSQDSRKPGREADYKGATPEQVAEAILRYRPDKEAKAKPTQKR